MYTWNSDYQISWLLPDRNVNTWTVGSLSFS